MRYFDPNGEIAWWILALLALGVMTLTGCSNTGAWEHSGGVNSEHPFLSPYCDTIDEAICKAISTLKEYINGWRKENPKEFAEKGDLEWGVYVYKSSSFEGNYYVGGVYNGQHDSIRKDSPYSFESGIPMIFFHTHPHDRNEIIMWNNKEISEMVPGIHDMILAYSESEMGWSVYYFPYNGDTEHNAIKWENGNAVSYFEMWGKYE